VARIFPSHGEPFSGLEDWVRETTAHHEERCQQILDAIAGGAATAHQIVGRIWTRPLEAIHHHFACFEILAHLEYMRRRGRVDARDCSGTYEWVLTSTRRAPER
jgi:hypothetical protein